MDLKIITLDTNAISNLFRGDSQISSILNNATIIYIPIFVISELHVGFKNGNKSERNIEVLNKFEASRKITRVFPDNNTIEFYSEIFINLKKKGKPIPIHDIWIAALAIQFNSTLISFDRHFTFVDKLAVWSE